MTFTRFIVAALILSLSTLGAFGEDVGDRERKFVIQHVLSVTGSQFRILEAAVREFRERGMDPSGYEIKLYRINVSHVVIFTERGQSTSYEGWSISPPAFNVEVGGNFEIIRAYFSR